MTEYSSTTAFDTGMQRQDKAYASTSECSAVRMPNVLLMQKQIWLLSVANAKTKWFNLTMDPILIVLLKLIQTKFESEKWGVKPPRNKSGGLRPMPPPPSSATHELKAVDAAYQRLYTTAGGEVQAPWDSIHEWRKAQQRDRYTVCHKPSYAWVLSLCGHKTELSKTTKL